MYALIEIKGAETKINLFNNAEEAGQELIRRYNKSVREANSIDWRYTWIDLDKQYAKVDSWESSTEWKATQIEK